MNLKNLENTALFLVTKRVSDMFMEHSSEIRMR